MTRSPRTDRTSLAAKEAELTDLVVELSMLGDDVSVDLAERLLHCQMDRRTRTAAGWPFRCKSMACWACRRAILSKWRLRAEELFAQADNADCSYVTILLARLGTLQPLYEVVGKLRRDLRNVRDAMARRFVSWNAVAVMGHVEVDALETTDVPLLGSSRRTLVPLLPAFGGQPDDMFWLPHAHLCVHHPNVHREYLKHALSEQWPGANRVDVGDFNPGRLADENAPDCISYGLKFRNTTTFADGMEIDWPLTWSARVWSWLHEQKNGLQPLSVRMGIRTSAANRLLSSGSEGLLSSFAKRVVLEPMPVVL